MVGAVSGRVGRVTLRIVASDFAFATCQLFGGALVLNSIRAKRDQHGTRIELPGQVGRDGVTRPLIGVAGDLKDEIEARVIATWDAAEGGR